MLSIEVSVNKGLSSVILRPQKCTWCGRTPSPALVIIASCAIGNHIAAAGFEAIHGNAKPRKFNGMIKRSGSEKQKPKQKKRDQGLDPDLLHL